MSDGYVFYRSFYEAIKNLDEENFKKCVVSLCEYALNDNYEPDGAVAQMFMIMAKPQVDANAARRKNGNKGGRPQKVEKEKKPKPKVEEPEADVEALFLNDGSEWRPTVTKLNELTRLYQGVDVAHEFAMMRAWTIGNPRRRKTKAGVIRFVNAWLGRCQNSAPKTSSGVVIPMPNIFTQQQQEEVTEDDEDIIQKIKEMQKNVQ